MKPPVLVAVSFVLLVMVTAYFLPQVTRTRAERWLAPMTNEINATLSFGPHITDTNVAKRLQAQATMLGGRASFHKDVMLYFVSNYYSVILLALICGGIAGAMLVLVSKNGWNQPNAYAVAVLISASTCATLFLSFPALFKQEENATKNKVLYIRYANLLNEMRTHALFNPICQTNAGTTNFIAYIDGEMAKANDIAVAFDPTKFPMFKNLAADVK